MNHYQLFTNNDGTFESIPLACPACGKQLVRQLATSPVFIYCPHGSCKSQVCNDGAHGKDIETAHAKLVRAFEGLPAIVSPNFENTVEAFLMRD